MAKIAKKYPYDPNKAKAVMFFSASSYSDAIAVLNSGINDVLTSYHYILKKEDGFVEDVMPRVKENGGLFMTDSGAFSFFKNVSDEMYDEHYWTEYIEKYVAFLEKHADMIYCAANMDLDVFVGQHVVDKWNKKYFEPLHKKLQIVYIVHGDRFAIRKDDPKGVKRFKEYASRYDYLGIASALFGDGSDKRFYQLARLYKVRLHGFGWTSIPSLKEFPFFSVDSTTWLGGVRYGTTYIFDGANAKVLDHKNKHVRKKQKSLCRELGINYEDLLAEKRDAINSLNLYGWKGFREKFVKAANVKLKTKPVIKYAKYGTHL